MPNEHTPLPAVITLEVIAQLKKEKLEELRQSRQNMSETVHELFAPTEQQAGVEGIMHHVHTGMAIYDGVRTGIKIMQRIRGFFRKKKK